jgi:Na+/melibiose symporter-like transporter
MLKNDESASEFAVNHDEAAIVEKKQEPFATWFVGFIAFFFMLTFGILGGLLGNIGPMYYVLQKNMSVIWWQNVTVIILILSTPLTVAIAKFSDNYDGKYAKTYGRRKPFILCSIPFLVLAGLMTQVTPTGTGLQIWYLVMMMFFTSGICLLTIPVQSWFIESTIDNDDYNFLTMFTTYGALIGAIAGGIATQTPKVIPQLAFVAIIGFSVLTCIMCYCIPNKVMKEPPKLPPLVPSFRQCIRTKEFRQLFINEVLLQISSNGFGQLIFVILYTSFSFTDTKEIQNLIVPAFISIFLGTALMTIVTFKLINKGYDKVTLFCFFILIHALMGLIMFGVQFPSMINAKEIVNGDQSPLKLQCYLFIGVFVIANALMSPAYYAQNLMKRDLIMFDTFTNKVNRENVYQVSLSVPANLLSNIIVSFFVGIISSTGYKSIPNNDATNIKELYNWNEGTIYQTTIYAFIFTTFLAIAAWYNMRDYPLRSVIAKKIDSALKKRDQNKSTTSSDVDDSANTSIVNVEVAVDVENIYTSGSESTIEPMNVSDSNTVEKETDMMLHTSALEIKVISESKIDDGKNEGLKRIIFNSYMGTYIIGPLAAIALLVGGIHQISNGFSFIQITFTLLLCVLVYLGYEYSRSTVLKELYEKSNDDLIEMAKRQVNRNKNYSLTLKELLVRYDIDENLLHDDGDDTMFTRMTLSKNNDKDGSKRSSKKLSDAIDEEDEKSALSGYKRIYSMLIFAIIVGILLALQKKDL